MKFLALCIFSVFFSNLSLASNNECVILLHGLAKTSEDMHALESKLKQRQYEVVNESYRSTKYSLSELGDMYIPEMVNRCLEYHPKSIHFVTHSMGGMVLQSYLHNHSIPKLKHIVMLAPPNHGSPLADFLCHFYIAKKWLGPCLQDLKTDREEVLMCPGPYKLGVIAGNFSFNPLGVFFFHEPHDGRVSVASTHIEQMSDWKTMSVSHSFITINKKVDEQIFYFLANGHFCADLS